MWEDETNAYELVSQELARMSKYVERNHGAIISLRGDASLCEFKSAVDAVRAAVEFQSRLDPKKGVEFRIGVHLGDVIEGFGKDVYGTSVNIVSRLESMADPGGICASNTIYESVKGKLNVRFEPAGEIGIRHVGEAIKAYRVVVQRAGSQAS